MRNYAIYPVIIIVAISLSVTLPKVYKSLLTQRVDRVVISYSPIKEDFVKKTFKKGQSRKKVYTDIDENKVYTEEEYKKLLPFVYYGSLLKINKFPAKFESFKSKTGVVRREVRSIRISPKKVNSKPVGIYMLFESDSKYGNIKLPKDIFTMTRQGIEFIISATNKIDIAKSKLFNESLLDRGFRFPMTKIFGNPSPRKSFDDGYFLLDSQKALFHLKMLKGKPFVKKVETGGLDIKYINIKEHLSKEFYGIIVTDSSELYLMMYDDYHILRLPIDGYGYKKMVFSLFKTPVYRKISIKYKDTRNKTRLIKTVATDTNYNKIAEHTYTYSIKNDYWYETISSYIFPYIFKIKKGQRYYYTFELLEVNQKAFIFNLILALLYLLFIKLSGREIQKHCCQTVLIIIGGVYTIIPLYLFDKILEKGKR